MRIMVVAPGPKFSTFDTFRYYTEAFVALGHQVSTFRYHDHYTYHANAIAAIEEVTDLTEDQKRRAIMIASEDLISRIARKAPDFIFVVSGLALPDGVWDWLNTFREALKKPYMTMVLFTESPYLDKQQIPMLAEIDMAATTDLSSVDSFRSYNENTIYVRHAYNPSVHKIMPTSWNHRADVFMVGTGFPERIDMLNDVDWSGIDLRVFGGNWIDTERGKPLEPYVTDDFLDNIEDVPYWYSNSKINLNMFRTAMWPGDNILHIDPDAAYSISPRCYEIMGCGGFLLTDERPELSELFEVGKDFVVFDSAEEMEDKIKYYLAHDRERKRIAMSGYMAVRGHTYVDRATEIMSFVEDYRRNL